MIIRSLAITATLLVSAPCHSYLPLPAPSDDFENDPLFNTKFITNNRQGVQEHLKDHYGVKSLDIKTEDGVTLKALSDTNENAGRIIVAFPGFYPGVKEGMAPLFKLLAGNHKAIIVTEQRGHGESNGTFWGNLRRYGIDETKDIEAVLQHVKQNHPNTPVTLLGLCTGGFNAARACTELKAQGKLDLYNVDSLIIDSAFVSGTHVINAGYYHFAQKVIPQLVSPLYPKDTNTQVRERLLSKVIWYLVGYPFVSLLTLFIRSGVVQHDPITRIDTNIGTIQETPILAVHSAKDEYAPKEHIENLVQSHDNPLDEVHIFQNSSHANNFLKDKTRYRDIIQTFLAKIKSTPA